MNNLEIAIVVVCYNRIDSLERLLSSLSRAYYPSENINLILSIDKSKTDIVEKFADDYAWPHGNKIVVKHTENLGLRKHILSQGKWFDKYDAIIILEDDLYVSRNFYYYALSTVEKYKDNHNIAGISLYSFNLNYQTTCPFIPVKDENDVYFMNCAMSWGEIWIKDQWRDFYKWYENVSQDFDEKKLPKSICRWGKNSWLKYHTRYCIEENKYFVHPYVSLITDFGEAGTHNKGKRNTAYQVSVQHGMKDKWKLPDLDSAAILYDGYFENKLLYKCLNLNEDELCIDLNGEKGNFSNKRYWLTTTIQDFKIVKSYSLDLKPIEMNIFDNNLGNDIFLYDTSINVKNKISKECNLVKYSYHISSIIVFLRKYTIANVFRESYYLIKNRLLK